MIIKEFEALAKKFFALAKTKLGFPTSFLGSNPNFVNNEILGIKPGSLSNILINEVGDPFKASETWSIEVKEYEVKIIKVIAAHLGLAEKEARGYVTSGGTEGNEACIRWARKLLLKQCAQQLEQAKRLQRVYLRKTKRASTPKEVVNWHTRRNYQAHIIKQILKPTLVFSAEHTHYSLYKIADALGLNVLGIESEKSGKVKLSDFKEKIEKHASRLPYNPLIVVANLGSTFYGAIDDVKAMREILEGCEVKPKYTIHGDGAMLGLLLPILQPFGYVKNYFNFVDTIALSFHKYLGVSQPSGIALTTNKFINASLVEYAGNISDITVSGSRSGLNILLVYNTIFHALELNNGMSKLAKLVRDDLEKARWCHTKLVEALGADKVFYNAGQFNILIPKPVQSIVKKYQLMVRGEQAAICVLSNVSKELIEEFIQDLAVNYEEITLLKKIKQEHWNDEDQIHILEEQHISAVVELFADSFCKHEPLVKYLQITREEFLPLANTIMHKAALDGLSVIAIDRWGRITGCAIAENFHEPVNVEPNSKLQPIFALFTELAAPSTKLRLVKNTVAHIWITAVSEEVQGKGLSTRLNNACVMRVLEKQYRYIYCEFTNAINERIMQYYPEHLKLNSIKLKDFVWNDTRPFAELEGEVNAYITTVAPFIRLSQIEEAAASNTGNK